MHELHKFLSYDPETGIFVWIKSNNPKVVKAGAQAGCQKKDGYRDIQYKGKKYKAHQLAYFLMTGAFVSEIDHIDNDPSNNKWSNLRASTHQQNQWNRPSQKNNACGYKGVSWHKGSKRWYAKITQNRKSYHLGAFKTITEAAKAYNEAALLYHGEFAYLNEVE